MIISSSQSPENDQRSRRWALLGLLLIAAAYVFPGLVGHDPWKQDEAYSFGIIYNMYRTGDLVVPTLAADPFMEKPPAYYITATGMLHLLGGWLPLHDAARLTTAIYLGIAFLFTGLLARNTWGNNGYGSLGVLLLISTVGLMQHGHYMITDVSLTAGMTIALYGLLRIRTSFLWGGLWLGTGSGLAFMSKGLLGPGIVGVSALLLPVIFGTWRSPTYRKGLLTAFVAALPWLLIWPTALYLRNPDLFMLWVWDNNFGRYLGFVRLGPPSRDMFWLRTLPWVTFPTLMIAIWTLWARRNDALANDGVRIMLVSSVVGWGILFGSSTARDLYAMPLLPPLAVLGAGAVAQLPRWAVRGSYWFSVSLFVVLAIALWTLWLYGLTNGQPPQWPALGKHLPLDFQPTWQSGAFITALTLQIGWLWVVVQHRPPRTSALLAWPTGLVLMWGIVSTLHLPWIDQAKSYRAVFADLEQALPADFNCVADLREMRLRESERGLLHYWTGIATEHVTRPEHTACDIILLELRRRSHRTDTELGPGWRRIWEGHRAADRRDLFVLFQRVTASEKYTK